MLVALDECTSFRCCSLSVFGLVRFFLAVPGVTRGAVYRPSTFVLAADENIHGMVSSPMMP